MKVLVIDTSSKACVLGIAVDEVIFDASQMVDRTHSKEILPKINDLLKQADIAAAELDLIIYGKGPGSFTGLRIGVGVTQGLAFGLDIPVVGVSSLAAIAQQCYRRHGERNLLVALLARLEEVYFGAYQVKDDEAILLDKENVVDISEIPLLAEPFGQHGVYVGNATALQEKMAASAGLIFDASYDFEFPMLEDLLKLGLIAHENGFSTGAFEASPEYLREIVASVPNK